MEAERLRSTLLSSVSHDLRTPLATITGAAAYDGLVNGESFSVTGTPSANFADKNVANGKVVTVRVATRDKYGRTVSWVDVGGKSVNEELVRAGLAWHYRQYDKSKKLDALAEFTNR